jgi:hypothetical protein
MKDNVKKFMRMYAMICIVILGACGAEEDETDAARKNAECTITLNGGPYQNYTAKDNGTATVNYIADVDRTMIGFFAQGNLGEEIMVIINFPGRKAIERNWDEETTYVSTMHVIGDEVYSGGHWKNDSPVEVYPGNVKITEYTSEGVVRGTFSGTMRIVKACGIDDCASEATVEGSFVALSN